MFNSIPTSCCTWDYIIFRTTHTHFFLFKTNLIFGFYHLTLSLFEDISNMADGGGERVLKPSLFKVICSLKLTIIRKKQEYHI